MLGNLSPKFRSRLSSIQLIALTKTSVIEEHGIDKVLEPFVEDVKKLESVSLYLPFYQKFCCIFVYNCEVIPYYTGYHNKHQGTGLFL